jgi:hypothetical protein
MTEIRGRKTKDGSQTSDGRGQRQSAPDIFAVLSIGYCDEYSAF